MKQERGKMRVDPEASNAPDSYRVKYEKLGSDQLIGQLRQNEELPKGRVARLRPGIGHRSPLSAGWLLGGIPSDCGPRLFRVEMVR